MREARCPHCGWLFYLYDGDKEGDLCSHCKRDAEYEARYGPDWRAAVARQVSRAHEEKPL